MVPIHDLRTALSPLQATDIDWCFKFVCDSVGRVYCNYTKLDDGYFGLTGFYNDLAGALRLFLCYSSRRVRCITLPLETEHESNRQYA